MSKHDIDVNEDNILDILNSNLDHSSELYKMMMVDKLKLRILKKRAENKIGDVKYDDRIEKDIVMMESLLILAETVMLNIIERHYNLINDLDLITGKSTEGDQKN